MEHLYTASRVLDSRLPIVNSTASRLPYAMGILWETID